MARKLTLCFMIGLTAAFLVSMVSANVAAENRSKKWADVGILQLDVIERQRGKFACFMERNASHRLQFAPRLLFVVTPEGELLLVILLAEGFYKGGNRYDIRIEIDKLFGADTFFEAKDNNTLVLDLGHNEQVYAALRRGYHLRARDFQGREWNFDLKDTYRGLKSLYECARANGIETAFGIDTRSTIEKSFGNDDVTQVLALAKLTDFVVDPELSRAIGIAGAPAWTNRKNLGQGGVVGILSYGTLPEFGDREAERTLAGRKKICGSDHQVRQGAASNVGSTKIQKTESICRGYINDGELMVISVVSSKATSSLLVHLGNLAWASEVRHADLVVSSEIARQLSIK